MSQSYELLIQTCLLRKVHATRGKRIRAEPVSALSEQHRVHLVGNHQDWKTNSPWSPESSDSPDRLDALFGP